MAYIGYFTSLHTEKLFSVKIRRNGDTSTPREIMLSGEMPFVVRYEENTTPFDPIRNSTATISVVADHYFEDVLPDKAYDTEVILTNETDAIIEWIGYLTPKVYSQGYVEENEVIQLEASDVLSMMQYMDYVPKEEKQIVSFRDVIANTIDQSMLKGFYWPETRTINGGVVYAEDLKISEMNFFSSDTEEAWKNNEVISEMCKYLGFTALQKGEYLYFADFNALTNSDRYTLMKYTKASGYNKTSTIYSGKKQTIVEKSIMGNDANIDFEPVYNKFIVKDNFYKCEELITNIFDDNFLTNRNGGFYEAVEIPVRQPYKQSYRWGRNYKEESTADNDYVYFYRIYDHKDYESVYRNNNLEELNNLGTLLKSPSITQDYVGATLVDFGRAKKDYYEGATKVIQSTLDWERYLCINQNAQGWGSTSFGLKGTPQDNMVVFRLKPKKSMVKLPDDAFIVIDFKVIFEKYLQRNYINPDWNSDQETIKGYSNDGFIQPYYSTIAFRLGFGNKYWQSRNYGDDGKPLADEGLWVENSTAYFLPDLNTNGGWPMINSENGVINKVSWKDWINEQGYKIPLKGVDTTQEITFEIFLPKIHLISNGDNPKTKFNAYCWIKDFNIKVARPNEDEFDENDVVYENVIDEMNVSEMSEITLKYTTQVDGVQPSYSSVIFNNGGSNDFVETMNDISLNISGMKPEQNIIQRYYNQYSTPTKKITYTLPRDFDQLDKYYGVDVDNPTTGYVQLGTEIDYRRDTQQIILIEKK